MNIFGGKEAREIKLAEDWSNAVRGRYRHPVVRELGYAHRNTYQGRDDDGDEQGALHSSRHQTAAEQDTDETQNADWRKLAELYEGIRIGGDDAGILQTDKGDKHTDISYIAIIIFLYFSIFSLPHFHNPIIYRSYLDVKTFFGNLVVLMVGEQQQVGALRLAMSQKQSLNLPFASLG